MQNHRHEPSAGSPNRCDHCRSPWNAVQHQPNLWIEKGHGTASHIPAALRDLAPYERPSGAPFVPSPGAPATHTGRPAQHSGLSDQRVIMCPLSAVVPNTRQCPFIGAIRAEAVRDHLRDEHGWTRAQVAGYLADPWFGDEARSSWKDRTFHRRYGHLDLFNDSSVLPGLRKVTEVQDSVVYEADHCDHPNGFGPMGCPCGASAPDEDAPDTVRNLDTGEDEQAVRCPVTIDCAYGLIPVSKVRRHLTEHGWTPTKIDDWMESVGVMDSPLVPAGFAEELTAERKQNRLELEALFMDPNISTEDLVAAAIDPDELAKAMDAMAPAQLEALLTEWWMDKAEEEVRRTVPKAVEYGATDLRDIGRDLAECMKREVTDEEATELGIYFYLRGKLSRWTDAIKRGDRVSDDTIFDLAVYTRMAQRNRDAGGWPGLPQG